MNIKQCIADLMAIHQLYGDIEVAVQDKPEDGETIIGRENFYIIPEEYDEGVVVNIRSWPY